MSDIEAALEAARDKGRREFVATLKTPEECEGWLESNKWLANYPDHRKNATAQLVLEKIAFFKTEPGQLVLREQEERWRREAEDMKSDPWHRQMVAEDEAASRLKEAVRNLHGALNSSPKKTSKTLLAAGLPSALLDQLSVIGNMKPRDLNRSLKKWYT